jgi:hypothetical protein
MSFMVMPERNAYGSQMSEQTLCQKLFRVESLEMKASTLSTKDMGTGSVFSVVISVVPPWRSIGDHSIDTGCSPTPESLFVPGVCARNHHAR